MTTPAPRAQLAAVAWLRWRMFANSLRSTRGKMEVVSRVIMTIFFGGAGFGGTMGCAFGAWYFVSQGKPEMLALVFWAVLCFVIPDVDTTASFSEVFGRNLESSSIGNPAQV